MSKYASKGTLEHVDDASFFDYLDWIKEQEAFSSTIYEDSAGELTVGYGHTGDMVDKLLLNADDPITGTTELLGITEQTATDLLGQDLSAAYDVMRQKFLNLDRAEGSNILERYDHLDAESKLLMLVYEVNLVGGVNKYPLFRDAVLDQDWNEVNAQYLRNYKDKDTGQWKPLTYRNEKVFEHFIKPRLTP